MRWYGINEYDVGGMGWDSFLSCGMGWNDKGQKLWIWCCMDMMCYEMGWYTTVWYNMI